MAGLFLDRPHTLHYHVRVVPWSEGKTQLTEVLKERLPKLILLNCFPDANISKKHGKVEEEAKKMLKRMENNIPKER